jgi:sarcosine oxidase subunit alpha
VSVIVDARETFVGPLPQFVRNRGLTILEGRAIAGVTGTRRVTGVARSTATTRRAAPSSASPATRRNVRLRVAGGPPLVPLRRQAHLGRDTSALRPPDPERPPRGADGFVITAAPMAEPEPAAPMLPVWSMPARAPDRLRSRPFSTSRTT